MCYQESLSQLVCLITGASRGIGRAIAHTLARRGASLALVARHRSELDIVKKELSPWAKFVLTIQGDISQETDVQRVVSTTIQEFGQVNALINNAGIRPVSAIGSILETSLADFDQIIRINMRGTFLCTKEVLPKMIAQGSGDIVNIGSVASLYANTPGNMAYRASKFGLRAISSTLRHEVAQYGIRVTLLCPGNTMTDMQSFRIEQGDDPSSWLQPHHIADVIAFILGMDRHIEIPEMTIYPFPLT